MFSMCSELTPRARIPDTRIPQLMQPCAQVLHGTTWYCMVLHGIACRLEICQKFYTTGFSGQKNYTLKVPKLRLFFTKKETA